MPTFVARKINTVMKFEDTQEIKLMRKTLESITNTRRQIVNEEVLQTEKLAQAVQESVRWRFKDFSDGEKVKVTYMAPRGPYEEEVTKDMFFHQPTCSFCLDGTNAGDYEICFRDVKKDGTESKRDDFFNHISMGRLISIEKI